MSLSTADSPTQSSNVAVQTQTLLLDSALRVKAASKSFYTAFHTTPGETLGEELANLGAGQWKNPALLVLLSKLSETDGEFTDLEMEQEFPVLGRRATLVSGQLLPPLEDAPSGMILLSISDTLAQNDAAGKLAPLLRSTLASIGHAIILSDPGGLGHIPESRRGKAHRMEQARFAA